MSKRKASDVWDFFKVDPHVQSKAVCALCGANVARGGNGSFSQKGPNNGKDKTNLKIFFFALFGCGMLKRYVSLVQM